jgi:hypothetical protein
MQFWKYESFCLKIKRNDGVISVFDVKKFAILMIIMRGKDKDTCWTESVWVSQHGYQRTAASITSPTGYCAVIFYPD